MPRLLDSRKYRILSSAGSLSYLHTNLQKKEIIITISNTPKQIKSERNICQEDLAVTIGSFGCTIGQIERGKRNAFLKLVLRLFKYLDAAVKELFVLDGEKLK